MPRPVASIPTALADLARALTRPAPRLPARVLRAARRAVDVVAEAIREEIAESGVKATAARLGVAESTLHLWRAGWLREPQDGAQGGTDDAGG